MTQALNLANFANNLNTSGATSNAGLQNSAVTVTAGTGLSGGGAVALGSSVTLTNAAPDQTVVLTSGSGISVTGTYPNFTIATSGGGGVTSLNGQTGAITNTTYNAIGSVVAGAVLGANLTINAGDTYAGSSVISIANAAQSSPFGLYASNNAFNSYGKSGTWRAMNGSRNGTIGKSGTYGVSPIIWMRVS